MRTPLSILLKEKSSDIQTLTAEDTCLHCAELLAKFGIGALLVMEGEKLQGIISERDLIKKLVSQKRDPTTMKVSDLMTTSVITVTPETTVLEA
ncbi:MAG: CBS domain-containing protein, partial [Candidatus Berkiella sp.]